MESVYKNFNETPSEKHARLHDELRRTEDEMLDRKKKGKKQLYSFLSTAVIDVVYGVYFFDFMVYYLQKIFAIILIVLLVGSTIGSLVMTIVHFVKAKKCKEKIAVLSNQLHALDAEMAAQREQTAAMNVSGEKSLFD